MDKEKETLAIMASNIFAGMISNPEYVKSILNQQRVDIEEAITNYSVFYAFEMLEKIKKKQIK